MGLLTYMNPMNWWAAIMAFAIPKDATGKIDWMALLKNVAIIVIPFAIAASIAWFVYKKFFKKTRRKKKRASYVSRAVKYVRKKASGVGSTYQKKIAALKKARAARKKNLAKKKK